MLRQVADNPTVHVAKTNETVPIQASKHGWVSRTPAASASADTEYGGFLTKKQQVSAQAKKTPGAVLKRIGKGSVDSEFNNPMVAKKISEMESQIKLLKKGVDASSIERTANQLGRSLLAQNKRKSNSSNAAKQKDQAKKKKKRILSSREKTKLTYAELMGSDDEDDEEYLDSIAGKGGGERASKVTSVPPERGTNKEKNGMQVKETMDTSGDGGCDSDDESQNGIKEVNGLEVKKAGGRIRCTVQFTWDNGTKEETDMINIAFDVPDYLANYWKSDRAARNVAADYFKKTPKELDRLKKTKKRRGLLMSWD